MLRYVVARNVEQKMNEKYKDEPNRTARMHKLSQHAIVSVSTLGRLFEGEVGPNIDTLEQIALALGCSVPDLMVAPPEFVQLVRFGQSP